MRIAFFWKQYFLSGLFCTVLVLINACSSPPAPPPVEAIPEFMDEIADEIAEAEEEDLSAYVPEELVLLPEDSDLPKTIFNEVWAYVVSGREQALNNRLPISDVVYFGADMDSYGKLVGIPNYRNIASFPGRKHLVAASSGRAITHFVLLEGSPERQELINDLLTAARPYDGLQIDFEYVPPRAADAFITFLEELRAGLGDKMLTIALPARIRTIQNDVYDYKKILPLVDRILVMAYDEHWSTSEPGPIASMGWSQRVARYALDTIGPEKLIMGLPFYGRSWGNVNANIAYVHSSIERLIREQNIEEIHRENGIPTFSYETPLSVTVYYEDEYSLSARLEMYKNMGVNSVGFWRLGQETPSFWPVIGLEAPVR